MQLSSARPVFVGDVFIGTTPIGSVITGYISGPGAGSALLVGAASCLAAAAVAAIVCRHTRKPAAGGEATAPAGGAD